MKRVGASSRMVAVGKHVGTSATSSGERIQTLQENSRDVLGTLEAIEKEEKGRYLQEIEEYKAAVVKASEFFIKYKHYSEEASMSLEAVDRLTRKKNSDLAGANYWNQLALAAYDAGDMTTYQYLCVHVVDLFDRAGLLGKRIENSDDNYKDMNDLAWFSLASFFKANRVRKSQLQAVKYHKKSYEEASHSLESYKREVRKARFSRAQANQNGQGAKVLSSDEELKVAQAGRNT
ncbi:hypothetical protein Plhal710r2_c025g0100101 [Plasmopara halstedii]